jgi:serine protease
MTKHMQFINKIFWLILLLGIFCQPFLSAQTHPVNYQGGSILVRLIPDAPPQAVVSALPNFKIKQSVSESLNIWLFTTNDANEDAQLFEHLQLLRQHPLVAHAQLNHQIQERQNILPNDPQFSQQWQFQNNGQTNGTIGADIGADAAWDISTGGITPDGDTIVVAVIDGAIHLNHADWGNNLWVNHDEIEGDNLDNDNNGYTDDYRGWNVVLNDDNVSTYSSSLHGTSVSGLIGASGNNNIGVSGVNWQTKIMFVAATGVGGGNESDVLAAYEYVLKARKAYNQSQGASGAFVVAVNCSFGLDETQPYESPLWCAMLDSLGQQGIIIVGATANNPVNVDVVGDIPTACPSNFLLAVTSLDHNNLKGSNAGYGAVSIDLGAYGVDVFTLKSGSTWYGQSTGTSFAAPQVSGAIGLLYSAPCPNLIALTKANPAAGATWARNILLESLQPTPSLEGITAYAGRLHIGDMMTHYEQQCESCPVPYWLNTNTIDSNSVQLFWIETNTTVAVDLRWRAVGSTNWQTIYDVHAPITLSNLSGCQQYQFMVSAQCANTQNSAWSEPVSFTTDGCCTAPKLEPILIDNNSISLQWATVTAAEAYEIYYRPQGASVWNVLNPGTSNNLAINNLTSCSNWEFTAKSNCGNTISTQAPVATFSTTGCGACLEANYCNVAANSAEDEWIAQVEVNGWSHQSEGGPGYENFCNLDPSTLLVLQPNQTCQASITPDFSGSSFPETFRIYVDFNGDGDFTDQGELAFDPGFHSEGLIFGPFTTPDFIYNGLTRMRVMMRYSNSGTQFPTPCSNFDYGQVEDYCVNLSPFITSVTQRNETLSPLKIQPQPASDWVRVFLPEQANSGEKIRYALFDLSGKAVLENSVVPEGNAFVISQLSHLPVGIYVLRVQGEQGVLQRKVVISR